MKGGDVSKQVVVDGDAFTRRVFVARVGKAAAGAALLSSGFGSRVAYGGAGDVNKDREFVIGFAIGESGLLKPYDVSGARMAEIAIQDLNARGGINGVPMRTVYSDTKSEISNSPKAAREVLSKGAKLVVTACDYDFGAGSALVANRANVLTISPCAGSVKFGRQGIGPLAFTMSNAAPTHAAVVAEWAFYKKRWRKAYVLWDTSIAYQKDFRRYFQQRWKELGGRIVGDDTFATDDSSIATQIARLKGTTPAPDVLILVAYPPPAATALRQIRAAGVDLPVMGEAAMGGNYWLKSVPNLSNFFSIAYGSLWGDDTNTQVNKLFARYEKKYGERPLLSDSLLGYAMIQVVVAAAKRAGSFEGPKLAAAMESGEKFPTVAGDTSFTRERHYAHLRGMIIEDVTKGKRHFVTYYTPKKVPKPVF